MIFSSFVGQFNTETSLLGNEFSCVKNFVVNIFSAFTHGGDAAAGCPTDTDWTVKNVNSWIAVKNFARCQGENEDEENAYRLSYSVCDIIKSIDTDSDNERVRSSLQKRKNTLCNRAMNHARVSNFSFSRTPHIGNS